MSLYFWSYSTYIVRVLLFVYIPGSEVTVCFFCVTDLICVYVVHTVSSSFIQPVASSLQKALATSLFTAVRVTEYWNS
jgi:hypothetical protein